MVFYRLISGVFLSAGALLMAYGFDKSSTVLSILGILVMIGAIVFFTKKHRCPHCNRLFHWQLPPNTEYCPYCGEWLG